jgi:hypothetical protein
MMPPDPFPETPMTRVLLALSLALLPACGKRKAPPPPPPAPAQAAPASPKPDAPGTVPQEFVSLVEREWPLIQKDGEAFLKKFQEAQALGSGDRAALSPLIEEANKHYQAATERWAEINNWIDDREIDKKLDQRTIDKCRSYLDVHERKVSDWTKKNKVLKEFSTAK